MPSQKFRILEKIRNLPGIKILWKRVGFLGFRGRCWGLKPKGGYNPLGGSHVVFCDESSIVDLFQDPTSGIPTIHQFGITEEDTELGKEVKKILTEAGYDFEVD